MIKNMEDLIKQILEDKEESTKGKDDKDLKARVDEIEFKLNLLALGCKMTTEIIEALMKKIRDLEGE